jgi:iron complex outermembrane receptor protein
LKHTLTPIAAAALLLSTCVPATADDAQDTIIVTATRLPEAASKEAVNVTVITRQDIERSAATTPQELLAGVAGVTVRNLDSSDNGSVDLRGFGVTGPSNTLILVDGLPLNTNDLSSPLVSTIALDRIERIEIVRGGSVAWGGGATGGVINIITRKDNGVGAAAAVGSHGTRSIVLGAGVGDAYTLRLDGQDGRSDGYRANDYSRTHGGEAQAGWHDSDTHLSVDVARDQRWQGFPGVRHVTPGGLDEFSTNPWGTDTPLDHGEMDETRYTVRGDTKQGAWRLALDASQRDKHTDSFFGDYGYGSYDDKRAIRDNRVSPHLAWQGDGVDVAGGFDWRRAKATDVNTYGGSASTLDTYAHWLELGLSPASSTRITLGERAEHELQASPGSPDSSNTLHAWQLGLKQTFTPSFSAYARAGDSYRLPNADELAINPSLAPQTAHDVEVGVDAKLAGSHLHASLFRINLNDEIAFQPYVNGYGNNINLAPTRHQGAELSWDEHFGAFDLGANLTWLDATFLSGNYGGYDVTGKRVPLVPELQGNVQLGWAWRQADRVDLQWHAAGRSRMDNDEANQGNWLAGWGTVDIKFSHTEGPFRLSLIGRNLADRRYASYGIVSTSGTLGTASPYSLYPEMGRNWLATLTYTFR